MPRAISARHAHEAFRTSAIHSVNGFKCQRNTENDTLPRTTQRYALHRCLPAWMLCVRFFSLYRNGAAHLKRAISCIVLDMSSGQVRRHILIARQYFMLSKVFWCDFGRTIAKHRRATYFNLENTICCLETDKSPLRSIHHFDEYRTQS